MVWWVVIGVRSRTNSVCLAFQVLHCCVVSIELRMNADESNSDEAELRPGCEVFDNYGEDDEVEDDDNDDFLSGFHFVKDPNEKNIENLAPYLPTPGVWLDDVLKIASTSCSDVVCDIGCGDGRIPIWAVQRFNCARGIGIDIDEKLIEKCSENAKQRNIPSERLEFIHSDATKLDEDFFKQVTVLVVYLIPDSFPILKDIFLKFLNSDGPGGEAKKRCVVIGWPVEFLKPIKTKIMGADDMSTSSNVYLYTKASI